jgi:hypothetical protein
MNWENTTLEWFLQDHLPHEQLCVEIEDGTEAYCRWINEDETLALACEDFIIDYDFGDYRGVIKCSARLYDPRVGEVIERRKFELPARPWYSPPT